MSDKRPNLVTGASGLIGRRVVKTLAVRFAPTAAVAISAGPIGFHVSRISRDEKVADRT